eukprot:3119091-Prymnesium_polylepis.1
MEQAVTTLGSRHLKLSDDAVGKLLAGVDGTALLRYDMPLERTGQGSSQPPTSELDHRPGNLRVRVLEANDLPA